MTGVGVGVRSASLRAAADRVAEVADELRDVAARLATVLGRAGPAAPPSPPSPSVPWGGAPWAVVVAWGRAEVGVLAVVGPAGCWGEAAALDALALRLRTAAAAYEQVEAAVSAALAGIGRGVDVAARVGWLTEAGGLARVTALEPTLQLGTGGFGGAAALVAAGEGLDGGRVRVAEVSRGDGGSAWVVLVPGTQHWAPRAGPNPFDLTTDVRAMTGDPTVAAAGVAVALAAARAGSRRSSVTDPVLLVGHSQGGILAAGLAGDAAFSRRHRVTHVLTTGAPVGLFPVPRQVRVLSVEHGADPVPRLDLTPNPSHGSWVTVRTPAAGALVDADSHRLDAHVATVAAAEAAPRGTVPGLDAWLASAGGFLRRPVRSVSEFRIERQWQNPAS